MYEYLDGTVAGRSAAKLVLDVAGVGYELLVPLGAHFPAEGDEARVWTHLVVREDAHTMYGFGQRETREVFRLLLHVRGVGPAMALGVLSGLPRSELLAAILEGDAARLTRIKGVGKKTAEQILLDLRDRAAQLAEGLTVAGIVTPAAPPQRADSNIQDAVAALASIGYPAKEARRLVERAAEKIDPSDLEALVRAAIQG